MTFPNSQDYHELSIVMSGMADFIWHKLDTFQTDLC